MKTKNFLQNFILDANSIDTVSQIVQDSLKELGQDKHNIIRLRLSVEEILLNWREQLGEETKLTLSIGSRFRRPFILLEAPGKACNPLEQQTDTLGTWTTDFLANIGVNPGYTYNKGINQIHIRPKRPQMNPLISLLIAIVCAAIIGGLGFLLPESTRLSLNQIVLTPIYNAFLGAISAIAGPMIFLSVAWGIFGMGDITTLGKIGKKMLLRFFGIYTCITAVCAAILIPFHKLNFTSNNTNTSQISDIFDMILDIMPDNIIAPFLNGNSMQIIIMAAAVGCIMLILRNQVKTFASFIEQTNHIIQFLISIIGSLIPCFIFVVILQLLWSQSLSSVLGAWKPLVTFAVTATLMFLLIILYTSFRMKVSPTLLIKKLFPTFLIATTTASSSAAFGTNVNCCEHELGIDEKMTSFGIPLGIVLYTPPSSICFLTTIFYLAEVYSIEVSIGWLAMAVFITIALAIATPPVPGGSLACYTIIFAQLGIPIQALEVALIIDMLYDFLATGLNISYLQVELLLQADKMKLLNQKLLHKDKTKKRAA